MYISKFSKDENIAQIIIKKIDNKITPNYRCLLMILKTRRLKHQQTANGIAFKMGIGQRMMKPIQDGNIVLLDSSD